MTDTSRNENTSIAVAEPRPETTLTQDIVALLRAWLNNRRILIGFGVVTVGLGIWFGRSSLIAAGLPPILLSLLPCALMCALGLCMNHKK